MSDVEPIADDEQQAEKDRLDAALERYVLFRSRVWQAEQGNDDSETVVMLHGIVGWELYYPGRPSFVFSYTTSPETTSPSASLGLANRLVANVEEDLGHRAVGVVLTSDDDEGED